MKLAQKNNRPLHFSDQCPLENGRCHCEKPSLSSSVRVKNFVQIDKLKPMEEKRHEDNYKELTK